MNWELLEGAPSPLGATWVEKNQANNFAIYSGQAEQVTLFLYGEHDFTAPLRSIPSSRSNPSTTRRTGFGMRVFQ